MADDPQDVLAVKTHAQTDKDAAQDKLDQAEQESDGLEASPLDELISPLYDFPQSNRSLQADPEVTSNDQTVEELTDQTNAAALASDQRSDETLRPLWEMVDRTDSPYVTDNGVLHRKTTDQSGNPYLQLVLPQTRRQQALQVAHSSPLAGHVGSNRTKYKLLKNFYWPGIGKAIV